MEFLKSAGAILVLISGVYLGGYLNRSAQGTLGQVEGFLRLLQGIRLQVECFSLPIGEILARTDRSILSACGWRRERSPHDLRELLGGCVITDSETERLLLEFSSEFGKGYRQEQLNRCDCCLRQIEKRKEELAGRLAGKKKVNLTLCTASAAAVVILLV